MIELKVPCHDHNRIELFKWNMKINRGYGRCICRYCNSMAIKQMFMDGSETHFVCDKCANNIIRSKMQICNNPECIFPSIRDLDAERHYTDIDERPDECKVCERYVKHLRYGFETHFVNMDFSLSYWDIIQIDRGNILADERAIAVQKYLQFKGFH